MKCQNMKIVDVLFFIANIITIYSTNVPEDNVSSQSTPFVKGLLKKNFDKDCPYLSKIVRDNNIANYTVDCKSLNMETDVINEENVRQQACFMVRKIMYFLCDSKYIVTPDLFKVNVNSVCPFNFSHIEQLNFKFSDLDSVVMKELTQQKHCEKVCEDLYTTRRQCAVLSQLNNYLKSQLHQNTILSGVDKSKSEGNKLTIQKVETSLVSKNEEMEQQSTKSKTKDDTESKAKNETRLDKETFSSGMGKNVTKPMGEQKTEKIITTLPKEGRMPKPELKISENENFMPGDDEFKSPPEDQNEDLTNEEILGTIADQFSDRSDMGKADKISVTASKGKEIYPAEGFFQAEDSHFFFYFIMASSIIVVGYLAFHNKNKILAYALEGSSGRRNRRRPNPARYRKLETNLEEAISSNAVNSAASNVVY